MDTLFNILVALAVFLLMAAGIAVVSYVLFSLLGWLKKQYDKADMIEWGKEKYGKSRKDRRDK